MRKTCHVLLVLLFVLSCSADTAACTQAAPVARPPKVPGSAKPIGVNLAPVEDWSSAHPFTDAFKQSRSWISGTIQEFYDRRTVPVDAHGNVTHLLPGQIARALIFTDVRHPAGKYTVLYDGKGKIEYMLTRLGKEGVVSSPGKDVLDIGQTGQITLNITATDPADPIRNVRVYLPAVCKDRPSMSCDGTCECLDFASMKEPPLFHPAFVEDHRSFGILRFMDWFKTNASTVKDEETRPLPTDVRWSPQGPPYEVAVLAAEACDADPWINIPHLATDDYVRRLAVHLRDHVRRDRRIYLELSNEVWNDQFPQAKWAAEEGERRKLRGDVAERRARAYSERTVEIMKIAEEVFGGTERLVRVMGAHAANPWLAEVLLSHKDAHRSVDAIAIAPYMGGSFGWPQNASTTKTKTPATILRELTSRDVPQVTRWLAAHKKLADKYGLAVVAYEGGTHLTGVGPAQEDAVLGKLLDDVERHPQMKDAMLQYLAAWKQGGGAAFVYFNGTSAWTKYGRWGMREYTGQPRSEAPKLDAVLTFVERTPRWWP